jgi:hypothetical protein
MSRSVQAEPRPAFRVRHEPPTIDEAIAAARGMTADRDQQVEIAAGLIGMAADQVRLSMAVYPLVRDAQRPLGPITRSAGGTFIVERKSRGAYRR